ncbi:MAG: hypothetical protein ACTSRG_23770 [Candidatus Helarchaeota archaeon]
MLREYALKHKKEEINYSLNYFQEMYNDIYSANLFVTDIEDIGFHLLEEIGEIAEALTKLYTYKDETDASEKTRTRKIEELENEIADTCSWIFTLSNKLREIFQLPDRTWKEIYKEILEQPPVYMNFKEYFTLSNIIWSTYGNQKGIIGCRDCKEIVCECDIYLIYDEEKIAKHFPKLQ